MNQKNKGAAIEKPLFVDQGCLEMRTQHATLGTQHACRTKAHDTLNIFTVYFIVVVISKEGFAGLVTSCMTMTKILRSVSAGHGSGLAAPDHVLSAEICLSMTWLGTSRARSVSA